ncbi:MAG: hypothetical protein ABI769_03490 [Pseudomonadota bacterium]
MPILLPFAASLVTLLADPYGGIDMAIIQKWTDAKVIKYHAEGVHKGRESVVFGDYEGKADVIDRVTVEFTWDNKKRKMIGPVTVIDSPSTVTNLKSDGTNCGPPTLKGAYEQFQLVSQKQVMPDQVQLTGTRTFPPAMVSNYPGGCSMRAIPGGQEEALLWVTGASAEALGMPIVANGPIVVAADRKSFSIKAAGNWVWTYTPALAQ